VIVNAMRLLRRGRQIRPTAGASEPQTRELTDAAAG
jgi:hypothetical protein